MRKIGIIAFLISALFSCNTSTPKSDFELNPYWQEEFNYIGKPDSTKWSYDRGGWGWGNNEWQYYTDESRNAWVENGVLTICAFQESIDSTCFSSARLVTRNKQDFLYGRFEVRAKVPKGVGTWPAIWMLPTDKRYGKWPASGEIDIMEHVGYDSGVVHQSVHTEAYNHMIGTQKTAKLRVPEACDSFQVYRIDWTPQYIKGFINDTSVLYFENEGTGAAQWPFNQNFHLLLNLAIGGNWGGAKGLNHDMFPVRFEIDYVRYYRYTGPI
jgi:beta-glucanase (GH16 family)